MMRLLLIALAGLGALQAHEVITTKITWSKEISRLVYKRCLSCHREGGQAPFSMLTYEQARPWAKAIKEEVLERRMPPWGAVKGFGEFRGDHGLTQEEITLIADWVEGGAPEGNKAFLPTPPDTEKTASATPPKGSATIAVPGVLKLDAPVKLVAIRPANLKKDASVQVIARRPDGSIEPLLWLYSYNPKFRQTYVFRSAVALPAGSSIELSPPQGSVTLFSAPAPVSKRKTGE